MKLDRIKIIVTNISKYEYDNVLVTVNDFSELL